MMDKDAFQNLLNQQGKGQAKVPVAATQDPGVAATALDALVDQEAYVRGVARDAALGAVVVTDDGAVVYVDGLRAWPAAASGKRVEVKGTLRRRKLAPDPVIGADGGISHGAVGTNLVVEGAAWTVQQP
jgi:hypothetical protein